MADKSFSALLINTCSIFKRVYTGTSAIGEKEYAHVQVSTNTKCRIQPLKSATLLSEHGQFQVDRHAAYFEVTVEIDKDYIVVYNGKEFAVVAKENESGNSHHTKAILETLSQ